MKESITARSRASRRHGSAGFLVKNLWRMDQPALEINGTTFAPRFDRQCVFLPDGLARGGWLKLDSIRRFIPSSFELLSAN
jgi:hypothetical protein